MGITSAQERGHSDRYISWPSGLLFPLNLYKDSRESGFLAVAYTTGIVSIIGLVDVCAIGLALED